MQQFLQDHNVSPVNSQRLTRHMKCRWSRDQGHDLADVSARLAPSLRGELSHEATGKALEKVSQETHSTVPHTTPTRCVNR